LGLVVAIGEAIDGKTAPPHRVDKAPIAAPKSPPSASIAIPVVTDRSSGVADDSANSNFDFESDGGAWAKSDHRQPPDYKMRVAARDRILSSLGSYGYPVSILTLKVLRTIVKIGTFISLKAH